MSRSLLVPITNVHAKGDYTAAVTIGSAQQQLNVIIDTGSASLVIKHREFEQNAATPTQLAQHVAYGMGSWTGPVVKTHVTIGHSDDNITLADVSVALAHTLVQQPFAEADGLLGLAFNGLDTAHNLERFLLQKDISPAFTFPWPAIFNQKQSLELTRALADSPRQQLVPYFDELESHALVANKFAFVVHRSSIYRTHQAGDTNAADTHPLNHGILVLGNPKSQSHLHENDFVKVKVVDERYYNVNIKSVSVAGHNPIEFPELEPEHQQYYRSNGILDTGASACVFPHSVFAQLLTQFYAHNGKFKAILAPYLVFKGKEIGIPIAAIDLAEWPDIVLELEGEEAGSVTLRMSPHTYWQTHAPETNQVSFKITTLPDWPNQGILGLPLINNYYTIFDRSEKENPCIEFANKTFAPHTLPTQEHEEHESLLALFKGKKHHLR